MLVIPAIDIIEGKCVRLTRGDFNTKKFYCDDPVEVAKIWESEGAELIHVVDLDGARTGDVKNLHVATEIKERLSIKVQYGGGIRDFETLKKVISEGIDRAIIGTKAVEDRDFLSRAIQNFGKRVICSVDFGKSGVVFKDGWQKKARINIFDFIKELEKLGVEEVIVTDITRDGTLEGADLRTIRNILKKTNIRLIIAGGISSLQDILNIKKLVNNLGTPGISGIIIGKALYEGSINLRQAIKLCSE